MSSTLAVKKVLDGRRETDCSLLVAGEDGLDVRLALEKVRPSVGLVYGLSERQTGGWDGSPSAALELVPAPGPAPHLTTRSSCWLHTAVKLARLAVSRSNVQRG